MEGWKVPGGKTDEGGESLVLRLPLGRVPTFEWAEVAASSGALGDVAGLARGFVPPWTRRLYGGKRRQRRARAGRARTRRFGGFEKGDNRGVGPAAAARRLTRTVLSSTAVV